MKLTNKRIKHIQAESNRFTHKLLDDVAPLRVDGDYGFATKRRITRIKFYLGYGKKRDAKLTRLFLLRLHYPHRPRLFTRDMRKSASARRAKQRHLAKEARERLRNAKGYAKFDGKTVAAWMVPWLQKSRQAGWKGYVVSGVRTAAYSEHLCYGICGASVCPGRCAGRASNHNMEKNQGKPNGALDVSDYSRFGAIQRKIGSPLKNSLGAQDPVHFSVSGS